LTEKHHPPTWRSVAAVVASDFRFAYFGTAALAVRLLRLDQKLIDGVPMSPRRMADVLNTKPELLLEFCGHLAEPGDETVTCTLGRLRYRFFETTEASLGRA
jgi:hypothetical protein